MDITESAPEIVGSKCRNCGSVLLRLSSGRWCAFCCRLQRNNVVSDSVLDSLLEVLDIDSISDEQSHAALRIIDDELERAYENGYDEGYSNGESNCDDSW